MKNNILVMFLLLLGIGVVSCNSKQTAANKEESDTIWNEKVQDTFFGLKLGSLTSAEYIVQVLGEQGFWFNQEYSTEDFLSFLPKDGKLFSFGGLRWEMLYIYRRGDILAGVDLCNRSLDKAEALSGYNGVKSAVETKYSPTLCSPTDTTVYALTKYFGRNDVAASVSCFRYESAGKQIFIGIGLSYSILNKIRTVNNEL